MQKGISPMISYLLYVGVGLSVVAIVATFGTSTLNAMRDSATIDQMQSELSGVAGMVDTVASGGRGTRLTTTIQIDRGSISYRNQSLVYELRTPAQIISTGTRQTMGPIAMTANAGTSLVEDTYKGNDCYRLENEHTETCIRKIDAFQEMDVKDVILYLENEDTTTTLEPDIDAVLNGINATSSGQVRTRISEQSQFLGTGVVRIMVNPNNEPAYELVVRLRTGADFLLLSVE